MEKIRRIIQVVQYSIQVLTWAVNALQGFPKYENGIKTETGNRNDKHSEKSKSANAGNKEDNRNSET